MVSAIETFDRQASAASARRVIDQREQQMFDGDEFVPLLSGFNEGGVQADFKFLGNHGASSITQARGC